MNFNLKPLDRRIREALHSGNATCTAIARFCDEKLDRVYGELNRMIFEGEIRKCRNGSLTVYEFTPKGVGNDTPEIRERILLAIRAGFRTLPGIKNRAGFERSDNIGDALEGMQEDGLIRKFSNSELSAYFECPEKPADFWLDSDGTVKARFEEDTPENEENEMEILKESPAVEDARVEIETAVKKSFPARILVDADEVYRMAAQGATQNEIGAKFGFKGRSLSQRLRADDDLRKAFEDGRVVYFAQNPEKNSSGKKGIALDTAQIEELAKECGTCAAAAKKIGVGETGLHYHIHKTPENTAAWQRGKAKFKKANQKEKKKMKTATKKAPSEFFAQQMEAAEKNANPCDEKLAAPDNIVESTPETPEAEDLLEVPEVFETKGFAGCKICGLPFKGFPKHIGATGATCDDCLEAAAAEYVMAYEVAPVLPSEPIPPAEISSPVETEPRFGHLVERLSEKSDASRNGFEQVKNGLAKSAAAQDAGHEDQNEPQALSLIANAKTLDLETGGAQIFLGFTGNVFEMNRTDRRFLNRFIDLAQKYKAEGK